MERRLCENLQGRKGCEGDGKRNEVVEQKAVEERPRDPAKLGAEH